MSDNKSKTSTSHVENPSEEVRKTSMGARATDSARVMKFTKALSGTMVILGMILRLLFDLYAQTMDDKYMLLSR